jgi:DNA-binding response OmpR family regulator
VQSHVPVVAVVTDDPLAQKLICQNLFIRNYAVATLTPANEAVALLAEGHHADLVILDITTPAPIGFGRCLTIRKLTDAPILVLSTSTMARDRTLAMKLGASAYLSKPFGMKALIHEVQRLLKQSASKLPCKELAGVG